MIRKIFAAVLCLFTLAPSKALMRDTHAEHILRTFLNPIFKQAGISPKSLKPFIDMDDEINAFATLDGIIVVNRGLIKKLDDVGSFVGVLAHETGHIAGRHVPNIIGTALDKLNTTILAGMAIGLISSLATKSNELGVASIMIANRAAEEGITSHIRANECAADSHAYEFFKALNWPLDGMVKVMKVFAKMQDTDPPLYLRSHPLSRDRVAFFEEKKKMLARRPAAFPENFATQYALLRGRLMGLYEGTEKILALQNKDGDLEAIYAKALAYTRLNDKSQALTHINKLLNKTNNDTYVEIAKAEILSYFGQTKEAIKILEEASQGGAKNDPLVMFELAMLYAKDGRSAKAKGLLLRIKHSGDMLTNSEEFWKELMALYDKMGEPRQKQLALAEMRMIEKKYDLAESVLEDLIKKHTLSESERIKAQDLKKQIQNLKHKMEMI